MKFSVYDPTSHRYAYYEGPGPKGTHAGSPRARGARELGATPEGAAWKLPVSAVKVGEGEVPIGRIASVVSPISALGDLTPARIGLVAGLGYLAWRLLR